jgi:diaminohydroxyphosphoribosylaminopyrimidine deaminase/5-amino-6-(5-phosphoribosylamino)uracil reductase
MHPNLSSHQQTSRVFGEEDCWAVVRAIADLLRNGTVGKDVFGVVLRGTTVSLASAETAADLLVSPGGKPSWEARAIFSEDAKRLLDLLLPLVVGERAPDLVVAHLGQSLDGRATVAQGEPQFITGQEDLCHTHRMRALFDAVVVGATTVATDNPQLTTRLVSGDHPVRVVLDPRGRLPHHFRVFTDGVAPTLVVTSTGNEGHYAPLAGRVEVIAVDCEDDHLPLRLVRERLRALGLRRLFVEGGGVTVSRFMEEGLLDRLQIAVAPKILGVGDAAIQGGASRLSGLRGRRFLLGEDVLFEFDFERGPLAKTEDRG